MQFGSYIDTCNVCRGAKVVGVLQERSFTGEWERNDMVPVALWDAMVAAMPESARIVDAPCFSCAGAGQVEYEAVGCKIF